MLRREMFVAAHPDKPSKNPEEAFLPPPNREGIGPDDPDLRRAAHWLKGRMTTGA